MLFLSNFLLLGGGATLDVGIYPIAMASLIFGGGRPENIKATGYLTDTGVDELTSIVIKYPGKIIMFSGNVSVIECDVMLVLTFMCLF